MIVDPAVTYSYSQMMRDISGLKAKFEDLLSVQIAGFSVEGRLLPVIALGTGNANLFLCGTHHAREYITSAYLMYTINTFAEAAKHKGKFGKYDILSLLSKCTLHVMPMVNPDGASLVQGGLKSVSQPEKIISMLMINPSYCEWKANINGVDLNRNYPALWDKKNTEAAVPASELYCGYEPESEPEVKAVIEYCRKHDFKAAISFHAKGEIIYYSDLNTESSIAEKKFAVRIAQVSGYQLATVSADPGIFAGAFETWFRQEFLRPALLAELTPSFGGAMPHNDKDFFTLVWNKAKYICAEAMEAALDLY